MSSFFMHSSLFTLLLTLFCFSVSFVKFGSSTSTVAISQNSNYTLICALITSHTQPSLNCSVNGLQIPTNSDAYSISTVVAGDGFFCFSSFPSSSLPNSTLMCWRFSTNETNNTISYKRIYIGKSLSELSAGNSKICGIVSGTNSLECWQWTGFDTSLAPNFSMIAVGGDFLCGLSSIGNITCLGNNETGVIGSEPRGRYTALAAGIRHACAISTDGSLHCWGEMVGEQPKGEFTSLALGQNRSCALRSNKTIACWGESNFSIPSNLQDVLFISIEAKRSIFCGIGWFNYSMFCWGSDNLSSNATVFENVLPGPCQNASQCLYGALPGSAGLCNNLEYVVCAKLNELPSLSAPASPPESAPPPYQETSSKSSTWNAKMVASVVVGCIGCLSLLIVICFFVYRYCKGRGCRVHDSGPLDDVENGHRNVQPPQQGVQSEADSTNRERKKRLSHLISLGTGANLEEFSLETLLKVTENFSEERKIGTGSFGSVYHAKLDDGRELAIKRAEASSYLCGTKRGQEDTDNAFLNELESLSRLNHKYLVRLLGFCEDSNERVLVYEYMSNGTLHDHLHRLENSPLSSWVARLKVALDAARGIEYLHAYAVPPIIHRDIKCSNILLDDKWTAKVSDFGLSLMGPDEGSSHLSLRAAGTVGYMDPEYYRLQQLTTKSDVYSFGIVLLELLSGRKAIHKNENGVPMNVVDATVPFIVQDEVHKILDPKVPLPTPAEIEAVAYVAYLAADCVTLEGRDRPSMIEVVNSLDRALVACSAPPSLSRSSTHSIV